MIILYIDRKYHCRLYILEYEVENGLKSTFKDFAFIGIIYHRHSDNSLRHIPAKFILSALTLSYLKGFHKCGFVLYVFFMLFMIFLKKSTFSNTRNIPLYHRKKKKFNGNLYVRVK